MAIINPVNNGDTWLQARTKINNNDSAINTELGTKWTSIRTFTAFENASVWDAASLRADWQVERADSWSANKVNVVGTLNADVTAGQEVAVTEIWENGVYTGLTVGEDYYAAAQGPDFILARNGVNVDRVNISTWARETITVGGIQEFGTPVRPNGEWFLYIRSDGKIYYRTFAETWIWTLVADVTNSVTIQVKWRNNNEFLYTSGGAAGTAVLYLSSISDSSVWTATTTDNAFLFDVDRTNDRVIYIPLSQNESFIKSDLDTVWNWTQLTTWFSIQFPQFSTSGTQIAYNPSWAGLFIKSASDGLQWNNVLASGDNTANWTVWSFDDTQIYYTSGANFRVKNVADTANWTNLWAQVNQPSLWMAEIQAWDLTTTQPSENAVRVGKAVTATTLLVNPEPVSADSAPTAPFGYTLATSLTWDNESTTKTANLTASNNKKFLSISNVINTANANNTARLEPQINTHTNYTMQMFSTVLNQRSGSRIDTRTAWWVHNLILDINWYIWGSGFIGVNWTTDTYRVFVNWITPGTVNSISYTPVWWNVTGRVDIYEQTTS